MMLSLILFSFEHAVSKLKPFLNYASSILKERFNCHNIQVLTKALLQSQQGDWWSYRKAFTYETFLAKTNHLLWNIYYFIFSIIQFRLVRGKNNVVHQNNFKIVFPLPTCWKYEKINSSK
jgi:hypothetical protein